MQAKSMDQESGDLGSGSDGVILKCSALAMAMFSIWSSVSKSVKWVDWSESVVFIVFPLES